jgi:hypothetical protein
MLVDPDAPAAPGDTQVTERVWRDADGKERRVKIVTRSHAAPDAMALSRHFEGLEAAKKGEHEAMLAELRAGLAEADKALADLPRIMAEAEAAQASAPRVIVKHECKPGTAEVTETTTKDGVEVVSICRSRIYASARKGLEEARAEIAADKDIPEETRKQILRTLDGQIARWSDKEG